MNKTPSWFSSVAIIVHFICFLFQLVIGDVYVQYYPYSNLLPVLIGFFSILSYACSLFIFVHTANSINHTTENISIWCLFSTYLNSVFGNASICFLIWVIDPSQNKDFHWNGLNQDRDFTFNVYSIGLRILNLSLIHNNGGDGQFKAQSDLALAWVNYMLLFSFLGGILIIQMGLSLVMKHRFKKQADQYKELSNRIKAIWNENPAPQSFSTFNQTKSTAPSLYNYPTSVKNNSYHIV